MHPVSPIDAHSLLLFLLQVGVVLLMALLLGRLAARLRMPAVVGELTAGVLLGPSVFHQLAPGASGWLLPAEPEQVHLLDAVGQIGVLLLVGITGAHLDLKLVRRQGATAATVSAFGLVIPLAMGVGIGYLLPASLTGGAQPEVFALFLGVAMCVSAIPVIAKTLIDMRLIHRDMAQLTLTAGMIDDAFGWLLLSVVSAMATTGVRAGAVALSVVALAGVLLVALVLGRLVVGRLFRAVGDPGGTVAVVTVIVLLSAAGTQALGLEAVFGAFVAGVVISEFGRPDPARLAPLRTVVLTFLAPVFFATAGLRMDLTALARPDVLGFALLILATAFAGKFLGAYFGARARRLTRWEGLALGAGMNARGVIQVIVAMVGLRLGVLNAEMYTVLVLVSVVTSLSSPPILRVSMNRIEETEEERNRMVIEVGSEAPAKAYVRPGVPDSSRSSAGG
ncbi:cation:proton antiporter [Actinomadura sp. KC216]|uniref:cation:proton antiporter n=1 Tax=Actinomadura sp. KC216 TaxID=2530370 RepID=UPI0010514A68|nr:cation:proton antiporter [Actinomadura sp. KC216]TDB90715.1 cation:proton antiporter [Actinomadura sp. KC216]